MEKEKFRKMTENFHLRKHNKYRKQEKYIEKKTDKSFQETYLEAINARFNTPGKISFNLIKIFIEALKQENEKQKLKIEKLNDKLKLISDEHDKLSKLKIETDNKNNRMEKQLKSIKQKMADYKDADQVIEQMRSELQKSQDELSKIHKKVILLISEMDIDVKTFMKKFLDINVQPFPDEDMITLRRDDTRIKEGFFDFAGATPFTEDTPEYDFKVSRKGWRCDNQIWVQAKLLVIEKHDINQKENVEN